MDGCGRTADITSWGALGLRILAKPGPAFTAGNPCAPPLLVSRPDRESPCLRYPCVVPRIAVNLSAGGFVCRVCDTSRACVSIGLAWSPSADEVSFTATATGFSRSLRGVSLSGKLRELLSAPGTLTLHDVGADGRALISRDAMRAGAIGLAPGENKERDLSWQDWTVPNDISEDGKLVLFVEAGEAGGGDYAAFSRETNGASAVRLGEGSPIALSPDGKWALVLRQNMSPPDFALLPTGVGQERKVPTGNVIPNTGQFFPDSKRGLFSGHEPGHASRVYVKNLDGGRPRPITPEGFSFGAIYALGFS